LRLSFTYLDESIDSRRLANAMRMADANIVAPFDAGTALHLK
jgi:hypothetical protein